MSLQEVSVNFCFAEKVLVERVGLYSQRAVAQTVADLMSRVVCQGVGGVSVRFEPTSSLVHRSVDGTLWEFHPTKTDTWNTTEDRVYEQLKAEYVSAAPVYVGSQLDLGEMQRLIDLAPVFRQKSGAREVSRAVEEPKAIEVKSFYEVHGTPGYVGAYKAQYVAEEVLTMLKSMHPACHWFLQPVHRKVVVCSLGSWLRLLPDISTQEVLPRLTVKEIQRLIDI